MFLILILVDVFITSKSNSAPASSFLIVVVGKFFRIGIKGVWLIFV